MPQSLIPRCLQCDLSKQHIYSSTESAENLKMLIIFRNATFAILLQTNSYHKSTHDANNRLQLISTNTSKGQRPPATNKHFNFFFFPYLTVLLEKNLSLHKAFKMRYAQLTQERKHFQAGQNFFGQ